MNQQLANFLLKGGRLIDPRGGRDGSFDIRVRDGKIDAIGANLALTVRLLSTPRIASSRRD